MQTSDPASFLFLLVRSDVQNAGIEENQASCLNVVRMAVANFPDENSCDSKHSRNSKTGGVDVGPMITNLLK